MDLSRFPRVRLGHWPTPLEPMENLTRILGGPNVYIKRDDCTGLATGGNKTRKLEFLMAEALEQGADTVVTVGAVQSNHVRQTAAAAGKLGLRCEILLERRVPGTPPEYDETGNVFLTRLLGADVSFLPEGADPNTAAERLCEELRGKGQRPFFIPGGGANPVGALGYVNCASELLRQADEMGLRIDYVVHGSGSGGTQAGLVVGLEGAGAETKVIGITVRKVQREAQETAILKLAQATAEYVGLRNEIPASRVRADSDYVGPGYGQMTPSTTEAILMTARVEGVLLDPVYTGKGMAGLIGLVRQGTFSERDTVVFLHTGGSAALFAYQQGLLDQEETSDPRRAAG